MFLEMTFRSMRHSDQVRYVGWIVVVCLLGVGVSGANYYQDPGIATTWFTWAILAHLVFLNYRLKLAID